MRKEAMILFVMLAVMVLVLSACEARKPTVKTPPTQNVEKPAEVNLTGSAASGNLTSGNLTGVNASKRLPCTITAEDVVELCTLQRKPKEQAPCFFTLSREDFGEGAGNVTVEISTADFNDYNRSLTSIPGSTIMKDPKPYSGYNEIKPFKYFWWWTGEKLVVVKATSSLCKIDEMKALSVRAGQR